MKIAYLFVSPPHQVNPRLRAEILPLLEAGHEGVHVLGMFFYGDNALTLRVGDPLGRRLLEMAALHDVPVIVCQTCAVERELATLSEGGDVHPFGLALGVRLTNCPDPHEALAFDPPERIISV